MEFAKKCPKCGGEIQTKNLRKSIGLGTVDIPVAQFCLNPVCSWYQDFSEAKTAEDIREDTVQIRIPLIKKKISELKERLPEEIQVLLSREETQKNLYKLGIVIFFCIILIFLAPAIMRP
jgi:ssDNA-binding Zn-finger/Zn-ribbon topoisomerase 1